MTDNTPTGQPVPVCGTCLTSACWAGEDCCPDAVNGTAIPARTADPPRAGHGASRLPGESTAGNHHRAPDGREERRSGAGTRPGFAAPGYPRAADITGMPEPILADFRARAVFGRRPSRHRPGTVFVVAVAAGKVGSCIEVGVAMNDQGRAVWIRNPDAADDLVAGFHSCLRAIGRTPTEWALNPPAAVTRHRLVPVTSR